MFRPGLFALLEKAGDVPRAVRRLGLGATFALARTHFEEYALELLAHPPSSPRRLRAVQPRGCSSPIHYRLQTTDVNVVQQVFLSGEYDCTASEQDVRSIVDCGANIGCASIFFLQRYAGAQVVAVEADRGNFQVCKANLAPYGMRAVVRHAAIWPRSEPLTVDRGSQGTAQEWAFQVRPCREHETKEVDGLSLSELADALPRGRIDLLKIDIEGGERELFRENYDDWIARTRTIVIELHGTECREMFLVAVRRHGFRVEDAGPVLVARREFDD